MLPITIQEIKEYLIKYNNKHYCKTPDSFDSRDLITIKSERSDVECIFFALSGSGPKGYGIYIKERKTLNLYDQEGKRFKNFMVSGITGLK